MNILDKYRGKKIGILGCDIEGKSTYYYLKKKNIKADILDRADKKTFFTKNPDLEKEGVTFYLGPDYLEHVKEFDVIFKTPGNQILLPENQEAIHLGVEYTSQTQFFFESSPAPIIGVTGTKGKGTTSTLIYEILKADGFDVYLGGNVGTPPIEFLDDINEKSIVVLELSSFQLQTLGRSPHISVVLNITQDHLDYHQSVDEYREAKKTILRYQEKDDYAVINGDYDITKKFSQNTKASVFYFSKEGVTNGCYVDENDQVILVTTDGNVGIVRAGDLLLRGRHNLENVTASALAAYLAGASVVSIQETVRSFRGLEHRLELVRSLNGVKYYNDSFSTTPETAIAAIKSFEEPIVLILGGSSKGSDYKELGKNIETANIKAIIFIGDTAKEISSEISDKYKGERVFGLNSMEQILKKAESLTESGDVVLLSPACASFGLFKNYKDRGNQFKEIVNSKVA